MNNSTYRLVGVAAIIGLLLLFAGYFIAITLSRHDKMAINVVIFPSDTEVTINHQKTKQGTVYLEPGTYNIKASRSGFKDYTNTLVVNPSVKTYVISLESNSKEGDEWLKDHQDELSNIRALGEQAAQDSGEFFNKKNPIAAKLPYRTFMYTIGYRMDPGDPSGNSIILEIDAPEGYRQSALYQIRQLGYDPTDFTINFRNYENPFPL